MAKVQIKSENLTPLEAFLMMEQLSDGQEYDFGHQLIEAENYIKLLKLQHGL